MTSSPLPTRRDLLRTFATGGAAAAAALLGGCGSTRQPQPAALPPASPTATMIMIIRHAEKPADSGKPQGIDVDGSTDSHSLTVRGWTRAGALVGLFAPGTGSTRPGLARPTAVYAAGGDGGEGKRTRQTITPLTARLALSAETRYARGDETKLAQEIARRPGPTLISWQHGEIPSIATAFGLVTPAPPATWPDNRFDVVWVLTPAESGWSFAQVPQLLLDGDSAQLIG